MFQVREEFDQGQGGGKSHVYEFPGAAVTKSHKLSGLKQHILMLSQFWGPDAPNQVVSRATLSPEAPGESPLLASSSSRRLPAILHLQPHPPLARSVVT